MNWKSPLPEGILHFKDLFKYRSLRLPNGEPNPNTKSIFEGKALWFDKPATFNDPFDCNLRLWTSKTPQRLIEIVRRKIRKDNPHIPEVQIHELVDLAAKETGNHDSVFNGQREKIYEKSSVFCWADRGDNIPMFSYYADDHRGICLQFRVEHRHVLGQVMAVEYKGQLPNLDYSEISGTDQLVKSLILTKSLCWQHEQEKRVFRKDIPPGVVSFPPEYLTRIIFGCRSTEQDVELAKSWLAGWPTEVVLARALPDQTDFRLQIQDFETLQSSTPPTKKAREGKSKTSRPKSLLQDKGPITQRPAFRAFALEDDRHGRRRLRGLGKYLNLAKFAPNVVGEMDSLYCDAIGHSGIMWSICYDRDGKIVHQTDHVQAPPEQAAEDLLTVAKDAVFYLSMLIEKKPDLCRSIASRSACWPVMADLTEKDWQSKVGETVAKLELGKDIKGYLLSARTADDNVIRCWATAIYKTLFQTRFDFKEAAEKRDKYQTTEICPAWAAKTFDLPRFTQAGSRKWAKLGEEMLLQQNPKFLDSPDLAGKKRSWTQRAKQRSRLGKATEKAIQREAFEDFAKELKKIAPERDIWRGEW